MPKNIMRSGVSFKGAVRIVFSLGQFLVLFRRYFVFLKMQMRYIITSFTPLFPQRRNIYGNNR